MTEQSVPAWYAGPPHVQLIALASGKWISQCVHAVAELGLADHIAAGRDSLAELAEAAGADPDRLARLLVVETVPGDDDQFDWGKLIDIEVMCTNGGRERTSAEWSALLGAAGFEITAVSPATPPQWVIEAYPR